MHAKALIIPRISHGPAHDSSALSYCAVTIMSVLSSLSSQRGAALWMVHGSSALVQ